MVSNQRSLWKLHNTHTVHNKKVAKFNKNEIFTGKRKTASES